jgi:hypothetical protein
VIQRNPPLDARHFLSNPSRERKGAAAGLAVYDGRRPVARGFHEVREFQPQGLVALDGNRAPFD